MKIVAWILAFAGFMAINLYAIINQNGLIQMLAFLFLGGAYGLIEKKLVVRKKIVGSACECSSKELKNKYRFKREMICSACAEYERKNLKVALYFLTGLALFLILATLWFFLKAAAVWKQFMGVGWGGIVAALMVCIAIAYKARELRKLEKQFRKGRRQSVAIGVADVSFYDEDGHL